MIEAFVQQQNRSSSLGKRFDYVALAPAAAALCYPFLLRAFHAIVGSQAATPSPLAMVRAILVWPSRSSCRFSGSRSLVVPPPL
jgi:hypothetical protein